jgi:hypothetical protein
MAMSVAITEHPLPAGVDALVWDALGATRNGAGWLIPERDARGNVIGTAIRSDDGKKLMKLGSRRGLTMAWPLTTGAGDTPGNPLLIVEGASDCAIGCQLGYFTIGRPSASGGSVLLRDLCSQKHVVFITENDDSGIGRSSARKLAGELVEAAASVRVVDPPEGAKDLREWFNAPAGVTRDELTRIMERTAPFVEAPAVVQSQDWQQPASLSVEAVPAMPDDIFDGWLGDMIEGVASATETPRELPAMLGLGVIATTAQRTFSVMPEPGYFEQTSIWTAAVLESGARKTAALKLMSMPLTAFERAVMEDMGAEIKRVKSVRDTMEQRIKALRGQAVNKGTSSGQAAQLAEEIASLESELPDVPELPRLITADITPERLGSLMAANNESMTIMDDEGGLFQMLAGRYSKSVNLDLHLKAYSGSFVRVDRGSRPPVLLHHPALTIAITPQPNVIAKLADHDEFRGRGLLGRFAFLRPESRLGFRTLTPRPLADSVGTAYAAGVTALLHRSREPLENPHVLKLDSAAYRLWKDHQRAVEDDMRPGRRLEHLRDWAGKLPGQVARIAGLLHIARFAHDGPEHRLIDADTMRRAVRLGELLALHAIAIFADIGADPRREIAERVLRWIQREGLDSFTQRDCWQGVRGNVTLIQSVDDLLPALALLEDSDHIREQRQPQSTAPGRRSRVFAVNPNIGGVSGDCGKRSPKSYFENTSSSLSEGVQGDRELQPSTQYPQNGGDE